MKHIIGNGNSIFQHFIREIRDADIQKDPMRFRRNMERIGEVMAYELSKTLEYKMEEVTTPLGTAQSPCLLNQPVIATILRAGLPVHQGFLNYFDRAENAFISAYRKHHKDGTFDVQVEYMSSPDLEGKTLILTDPMLATGSSMLLAYKGLLRKGKPAKTHVVSVIASMEGLDYVMKNMPEGTEFWIGAVDEELTVQSYIVPGLGDAGDLAFGIKT
jgi:uracil phosphoribosyltransferase